MERNEPTTGEIVRALTEEERFDLGGKASTIHLSVIQNAIDLIRRLQSANDRQERDIARLTEELDAERRKNGVG